MITKQCKTCNTDITNLRSIAEFCSRKCYFRFRESWRKEQIKETNCLNCSKVFLPKTRKITRYCSIECSYDHRNKTLKTVLKLRECENCQIEFTPNRAFQKYCSHKCGVQFKNTAVRLGLTVNEANREIKELKEQIQEQETIRQEPIPEGMTLGVCSDCGKELKTMDEYLISRCSVCDKINKNKLVDEARKRQFGNSFNLK